MLKRPEHDSWYASLTPDLARIEVPMLVCASFSDHSLHTRGSFEVFRRAGSRRKKLYTHRDGKWCAYYSQDAAQARLRFFDSTLKGLDNGWDDEPAVRLAITEAGPDPVAIVHEASWPPGGMRTVVHHKGGLARWQERRALEFLEAHGLREISIAQIAEECRLSRSYFTKAFKRTLGQTPHRWLMQRRVEKAREMLLDQEAPIAQISDSCGFGDQSHLTQVFTTTFGMPPGVWRRQYRSEA